MAEDPNAGGQGADPTQAFQNRLSKMNGDAMAFATQLFDENWRHRERIRELEGKVPKEGDVVLSKADGEKWAAFLKLGKKPDELAGELAQAGKDVAEVKRLTRKDTLRDVAAAHGLKLSVLEDLDGKAEGLEYIPKDEKDKQGQVRKVYHVKDGDKESPFEQFAAERWADYLPALKAEQGANQGRPGHRADPPPAGGLSTLEQIKKREEARQQKAVAPTGGSLIDRFRGRTAGAQ